MSDEKIKPNLITDDYDRENISKIDVDSFINELKIKTSNESLEEKKFLNNEKNHIKTSSENLNDENPLKESKQGFDLNLNNTNLEKDLESFKRENVFSSTKPKPHLKNEIKLEGNIERKKIIYNSNVKSDLRNYKKVLKISFFISLFFSFLLLTFSLLTPIFFQFGYNYNDLDSIPELSIDSLLIVSFAFAIASAFWLFGATFIGIISKKIYKEDVVHFNSTQVKFFVLFFTLFIMLKPYLNQSKIIKEHYIYSKKSTKKEGVLYLILAEICSLTIIGYIVSVIVNSFISGNSFFINFENKMNYIYIIELFIISFYFYVFFVMTLSTVNSLFVNRKLNNIFYDKEISSDIKIDSDSKVKEKTLGMGSLNEAVNVSDFKRNAFDSNSKSDSLLNYGKD